MTEHRIVDLVTVARCQCGEEVYGSSEQAAEGQLCEHIKAAEDAEARAEK